MELKKEDLTLDTMVIKQKKEQYAYEIRRSKTEKILNAKRAKLCRKEPDRSTSIAEENMDPNMEVISKKQELSLAEKMKITAQTLFDGLRDKNERLLQNVVRELRYEISEDENIPIDEFISCGLQQALIILLTQWTHSTIILHETLWIATNVFSAPYSKISDLYSNELVRAIIGCLAHTDLDVIEEAAQALSNIAGDNDLTINLLLEEKITEAIVALINQRRGLTEEIFVHLASLISNLFHCESPHPQLGPLLRVAERLTNLDNEGIRANSMWVFANVTLWPETEIKLILSGMPDLLKVILKMLDSKSHLVLSPTLRTVGNLGFLSHDIAMNQLIELGLLSRLKFLIKDKRDVIRYTSVWALVNVVSEDEKTISKVISEGIAEDLLSGAFNEPPEILEEILFWLNNMIEKGNSLQIYRLQEHGMMNVIANSFGQHSYPGIILKALLCFKKLLKLGERLKQTNDLSVNPFMIALDQEGGVKAFESLQKHKNDEVYLLVTELIDEYFSEFTDP